MKDLVAPSHPMDPAALEIRGLSCRYGGPRGHLALDRVSLDVAAGEYFVIVGPSGSGKSTLLRLIAGLEEPREGSIVLGGRDLARLAPRDRLVAMVFQNSAVYPHLSVFENLAFGMRARGFDSPAIRVRVDEVAGSLGLDSLLDRRPQALSGGQRQRVALGRALATRPKLFLLDEPLASLDAPLRVETRTVLARLHRETGTTFLHVTHDQSEALALGDRIGVLHQGQLVQVGTPRALFERPGNRFVGQFLGTPPMDVIPVRVVRNGDEAHLHVPGWEDAQPIATTREACPEGTFHLGLRPEDVRLAGPPEAQPSPGWVCLAQHGQVESHEYLGRTTAIHVRLGPFRLTSIVASPSDLAVGQRVALAWNLARAPWFDPVTGRSWGVAPVAGPASEG